MKWLLLFICSILFFSGCCGSEVVLRKVEVKSPGINDTLESQEFKFTDITNDSLIEVIGYKGISFKKGSTKDNAAVAEFIPALKKFILKIPERIDTVFIQDTIRIKPNNIMLRGEDNSEKLIWIISFTLTTVFIMIYKRYSNVRKSSKEA